MELKVISRDQIICEDRIREDLGDTESLVQSFKERGLMQPLVVMQLPDSDKYKLLAGGRRFHATGLAGLDQLPVHIYTEQLSTLQMKEVELEENLLRKNLTWQEEVKLKHEIHTLKCEQFGAAWSQRKTASLLGESNFSTSNDLRLASALRERPELGRAKTKTDALREVHSEAEKIIKQELARRAETTRLSSGTESSTEADGFIIGDFFNEAEKIPNESVDFIDLDPPWGVSYDEQVTACGAEAPSFKDLKPEQYSELLGRILEVSQRILKDKGWLVLWYGIKYHHTTTLELLEKFGFSANPIPAIWFKPGNSPSRPIQGDCGLTSAYETFIYASKGKDGRTVKIRPNVYTAIQVQAESRIHPTEKPIELMQEIINTFCLPNMNICVPFLGSGNTLIAARRNSMRAFGYEEHSEYKGGYIMNLAKEKARNGTV